MLRITFLLFLVLSISGCEYTFTEEAEIEDQLLSVTPLGTSAAEVEVVVADLFGEEAYVGIGISEQTDSGWGQTGWLIDPEMRNGDGSYVHTYKIGSHPSKLVVLPTYVYAQWFFDTDDQLVQIRVLKEMDSL
ncbi:MAG: hypothetical protein Q8N34_10560 [Gammaproteobacteria bacterium]|nr:hypothetical protein [Gammaproteobacteria bacterium]